MTGSDGVRVLTCDEVREMAGAFVLGALDPAEDASVRAHLETCADAHAEIAELGGVLPALAESVPVVEPPAGLKGRIMAAAAADLETRSGDRPGRGADRRRALGAGCRDRGRGQRRARDRRRGLGRRCPGAVRLPGRREIAAIEAGTVAPATPEPIPFPVGTERAARRRTPTSSWVLRIAAVVAIVGLAGWNFLLRNQLDAAQSYEQSVAAVIEAAGQPGALTAILTPDCRDGDRRRRDQLGRAGHAGDAGPRRDERRDGLHDVGHRRRQRPGRTGRLHGRRVGDGVVHGRRPADRAGRRHRADPRTGPGATAPTGPVVSKGAAADRRHDRPDARPSVLGRRPRPDHPATVGSGPCRAPRSRRR